MTRKYSQLAVALGRWSGISTEMLDGLCQDDRIHVAKGRDQKVGRIEGCVEDEGFVLRLKIGNEMVGHFEAQLKRVLKSELERDILSREEARDALQMGQNQSLASFPLVSMPDVQSLSSVHGAALNL